MGNVKFQGSLCDAIEVVRASAIELNGRAAKSKAWLAIERTDIGLLDQEDTCQDVVLAVRLQVLLVENAQSRSSGLSYIA